MKKEFLVTVEYPEGDHIPSEEFVECIGLFFDNNIMDGHQGRLKTTVKEVAQEVETVFEVGDVVRVVQCPMYPEYIGSVGRIVSYVTSNGQRLYKVERNNKLLRGYALNSDLQKVKEGNLV